MLSRHIKFLDLAELYASENKNTKNKHAAIITKGNKIISIGTNNNDRSRMSEFKHYNYYGCHAELDAVMKVKKRQCLLWDNDICC